jgi:two-component system chemotaxis response regulator CheB
MEYEIIAIGTSWGGMQAVSRLLDALDERVHQPIVVVQHRSPESEDGALAHILGSHTKRIVCDPNDKTQLERDHVYLGPPDYHLLVEDGHVALSTDEPVQFARPSIDVLFDSVADSYGERAIGVVLTGANDDGAAGLARIQERGGVVVVQEPATSERRTMPDAAIAATHADAILPLDEIPKFLYGLCA